MNLPPEHYFRAEFEGAPCPTIQEYLANNRAVREGEQLIRCQSLVRTLVIVAIIFVLVATIASAWI